MKVGDTLKFKKFKWVITRRIEHPSGHIEYRYRVYRKYFKLVHLTNTKQDYPIAYWRWSFLKDQLKKDPNYHYTMNLWSNATR